LKNEFEEKVNHLKKKYENEINHLIKENQDMKIRIDKLLEEYQINLKQKDSLTKKV